jgi:hypothetical protein
VEPVVAEEEVGCVALARRAEALNDLQAKQPEPTNFLIARAYRVE